MKCDACGFDALAEVKASWGFRIEADIQSANAHIMNAGVARHAYRRQRDTWQWYLVVAKRLHDVTNATGPRRVTVTRWFSGRQRAFDRDNLIAGCKSLLDALVRSGMLRGDTEADVQVLYKQERAGAEDRGTFICIEELA